MRFTTQTIFALLMILTPFTNAQGNESKTDTFSSLIAEGHATEKRLHRQLLRALGAQNPPMQAAIETPPSESSDFEVKLAPSKHYK